MSEVISFRLDKDNLREAKALLVLQEWKSKGYSIRQTITEALVNLDRNGQTTGSSIVGLNEALSHVNHLLRLIESSRSGPIEEKIKSQSANSLSTNFIVSVKKSVKSGLKLD